MTRRLLLSLLLGACLFSGCKKKNENENEFGFLRAKVDGVAFEAATVSANVENGIAGIVGFRELLVGFTLNAFNFTGPGRYPVNASNAFAVYSEGSAANPVQFVSTPSAPSGEFVITSYANDWLKGTFHFTGVSQGGTTKTITDGVFEIRIQE